ERVAPGPEDVEPLTVAEEDRGLVLAHDQLRPHLDVARALLRIALHDAGAGLIEPLDDFHHDRAHGVPPSPASTTRRRWSQSCSKSSRASPMCSAAAASSAGSAARTASARARHAEHVEQPQVEGVEPIQYLGVDLVEVEQPAVAAAGEFHRAAQALQPA